jgi:type I restriction enzyme, S subunit
VTQYTQLGDVADIVRGIAFPKKAKSLEPLPGHFACLRTTNVQRQVEWGDLWFVPVEHVRRDEQFVRAGDILISTANSYELVGKVAPVVGVPHRATLGAFISLIRAREGVEPKYLYHLLAWGKTQGRIRELASTTTNISNVSTKKLALLDLHVPPLGEQRLAVAELEKQFSRLDEAVANLQRVKANLKRYKGAVLQSVTGGQLETEGQSSPERGEPGGWRRLTIEELASSEPRSIQSGPFGSNLLHSEFQASGKLVIGIDNVQDGAFSIGADHRISELKFEELEKYRARPKDVLITVMATVGRVCVLPENIEPAVITKHVYRITVDRAVALPEYVGIALRGASEVRAQLFASVQGQTRPGLNGTLIKRIRVPIPPLAEQHRIVAEVDRRLSIVREVGAEVDANLKRAQALRQAVLHKAFGG